MRNNDDDNDKNYADISIDVAVKHIVCNFFCVHVYHTMKWYSMPIRNVNRNYDYFPQFAITIL